MKKIFFSTTLVLLSLCLFAQPGKEDGRPKPPLTERWKRDSIKLQLYVGLETSQLETVKTAFMLFYKSLDATAPKEGVAPPKKENIQKLLEARNNRLKATLNAKQWDRFETFEKEFRPPHPEHEQMPPPPR